ncbi:hypothetical protein Tco_0517265 [Tanacetum coccineum]
MKIEQFQVSTKFLNSLPPEWSKFMTDVKLVKDLHTINFDQLHAYLEQYELHATEVHLLRKRNQDPLAFVANQQMTPPHFNTYGLHTTILSFNNSFHHLRDDPITCLNKEMTFLKSIASSRFPSTNNQLRTSSNLRNQANIQDGRVTVNNTGITRVKLFCSGSGTNFDEEQTRILAIQGFQPMQTRVLMANSQNYGSNVTHMANKEQNNESVAAELERYKERVKTFEQRLNIDLSSREKMIDSPMDDMIKEKLALKEEVDSLEQIFLHKSKKRNVYCKHSQFSKVNPKKRKINIWKMKLI